MDITLITTIFGILIIGGMAIIGSIYIGMIGAMMLATLALLGLALIPATPIIPIWLVIMIISAEVIFLAYKIANSFGLGQRNGE